MHKGSFALLTAVLTACALPCHPQVLSPPEILDPAMRALQQKHLPELKAAAVDITSHHYPFKFYLSRKLDVTEQQEQLTDQRSIRFTNFQGQTVVQITGNYFAAYADSTDRNKRVEQTYMDVMLPILRAMEMRLSNEPQLNAFAIEVAHHVRKKVLGVTVENPENIAIIIPSAVALHAPTSNNATAQLAVLKQSSIYIDSQPVALWSDTQAQENKGNTPSASSTPGPVAANTLAKPPLANTSTAPPPASVPAPVVSLDISPEALQKQQTAFQDLLDKMVRDLDSQAHFVSYAPPTLIAFHKTSYLQLSVTTSLYPSDSGSQYRIAALAFDRHVSHLIRPVLAIFQKDPEFDGIVFSSTVRVSGNAADTPVAQSVEFFLPLAELRSYAQYDITGQQLINSGLVLINGERVGLELQSAEGANR